MVALFFTTLNSLHDFLSMIFGFLGKFGIDIAKNIFRKNIFSRSKKIREKDTILFFMIFHDFSRFSMVSLSNLLRETIENLEKSWKIMEKNISRFFRDFFVFQKKSFEKIFLPISIRNLLRNPKIILKKSCGEFKDPYQKKAKFFYIF